MCFKMFIFICFLAYGEGDDNALTVKVSSENFHKDEILHFNCSSRNNYFISMHINDSDTKYTVPNTSIYKSQIINRKILKGSYKMNFTSDTVILKCVAKQGLKVKGTDSILLTRNKTVDDKGQDAANEVVSNSDPKSDGDDMTDKLNKYAAKESDKYDSLIIWILVVSGIVIIIILIIIIIKICRSSKTDTAKSHDDVTYENFCNESGTPTPFPRSARLEETYLRPSDCRESPYAIPTTDNETYALPYVEKNIDNLYSKPVPKSQRSKDKEFKSLYTAVLPKSLRPVKTKDKEPFYAEIDVDNKSCNRHIDKNLPEYTLVMKSNEDYENLGTANKKRLERNPSYTNVFPTNAPYVNSKDNKIENDDYAEPSYCEINKLRDAKSVWKSA